MIRCYIIMALTFVVLATGCLVAEEPDPAIEKEVLLISSQIMSPFCPGRLLHDCPSSQALELKGRIREMLLSGKSRDDVFNYLYSLYGPEISALPSMQGFDIYAWLAPAAFLIFGFCLLAIWLKKKKSETVGAKSEMLDAKMQARIDSEMSR